MGRKNEIRNRLVYFKLVMGLEKAGRNIIFLDLTTFGNVLGL